MSYCINPLCPGDRKNPNSAQFCQYCRTALTIEGSRRHYYQLIKPLSFGHPYTEIFQAIEQLSQPSYSTSVPSAVVPTISPTLPPAISASSPAASNASPKIFSLLFSKVFAALSSGQSFRLKPWMFLLLGAIALTGGIGRVTYCRSNPVACGFPVGNSPADNSPPLVLPADRLMSTGERSIENGDSALQLEAPYRALMQAGMTEFAKGNFGQAAKQFRLIRETATKDRATAANDREKNDANQALRNPLPLIYERNAIVRERNKATGQPIYSFGVAVPLNTDLGWICYGELRQCSKTRSRGIYVSNSGDAVTAKGRAERCGAVPR